MARGAGGARRRSYAGIFDDARHYILTGREKGKERREILAQLESGEIDFLVGTHALIQDDVVFKALALADSLAKASDPRLADGLLASLRSGGLSLLADGRARELLRAIRDNQAFTAGTPGRALNARDVTLIGLSHAPIEKVAIRPEVTSRMLATTALESTPPERNTPSGTSLSRRRRTASRNPARTAAALSSRLAPGPGDAAGAGSCQ